MKYMACYQGEKNLLKVGGLFDGRDGGRGGADGDARNQETNSMR